MRIHGILLGLGCLFAASFGTYAAGQGATQIGGQTNIGPGVPVFPCNTPNEHYFGEAVIALESNVPIGPSSGVHVDAVGGPDGAFGFFLLSNNASTPVPVGQGLLCLTLPIARFNSTTASYSGNAEFNSLGQFDPNGSGVFVNLSGTAPLTGGLGFDVPVDLPPPFGPGQFQMGDTWWLQLWYRDRDANGLAVSNFSSAVEVEIP
jgi:hypothetical protein